MKDGKETSEYQMTKVNTAVSGTLATLAALAVIFGYLTADEAQTLQATLAAGIPAALVGIGALVNMGLTVAKYAQRRTELKQTFMGKGG